MDWTAMAGNQKYPVAVPLGDMAIGFGEDIDGPRDIERLNPFVNDNGNGSGCQCSSLFSPKTR
jgi:hypothetical protein